MILHALAFKDKTISTNLLIYLNVSILVEINLNIPSAISKISLLLVKKVDQSLPKLFD